MSERKIGKKVLMKKMSEIIFPFWVKNKGGKDNLGSCYGIRFSKNTKNKNKRKATSKNN
jgi:hypothetical protein